MSRKTEAVALATVVALVLLTASCAAPSSAPAPVGNSRQTVVPTRVPGAQPTAPNGRVSVPREPSVQGGGPELPYRIPGEQPVDPGPVVVVPSTPSQLEPPPPPGAESTPTTEPSEQLPIPEVP